MRFCPGHNLSLPLTEHFWANVEPLSPNECWIWKGSRPDGRYGRMKDHGVAVSAHRVSYELHHGPIPSEMQVLHKCDNPPCVNPNHLFIGTPLDNMQDKTKKGRAYTPKGKDNPSSRLDTEQVLDIRRRVREGEKQSHLGAEYGISQQTVSEIVHYKIWRHVP